MFKNQHHREPIFRGRIGGMVGKNNSETYTIAEKQNARHYIFTYFTHSFQNTDVTLYIMFFMSV